MKKTNIATGVLFLLLSIFAYVQTLGMVSKLTTDQLGPSFWPKCLSIGMGILSLLLIVKSLIGKKQEEAQAPFSVKSEGFRRVVKICGVMILFGALIYVAGIYVGMLVMLPLCMLLHGERNVKVIVGLTVAIIAFIFLVFATFLKVPLPMGLIFEIFG